MFAPKNILIPYDFSDSANEALKAGARYAEKKNARLHLLFVEVLFDEPEWTGEAYKTRGELFKKRLLIHLESVKDAPVDLLTSSMPVHFTVFQEDAVTPGILRYIKEYDIDLILMGTHGRRGIKRTLLGSVAEETVRTAPCPVLTLHEEMDVDLISGIKDILLPIDFSEPSRMAVAFAKELAHSFGARLHLMHVVEDMLHPVFYHAGAFSIYDLHPNIDKRSEEELKKLFKESEGPEVEHDFYVIPGNAEREILARADAINAGMIVMPTHGLTGLDRAIMGSVAERVVRKSAVPVLTLRQKHASDDHPGIRSHSQSVPFVLL